MDAFRSELQQAAGEVEKEQRTVPGAVVLSSDREKTFEIREAFGSQSLEADKPRFDLDSAFWVASCTKLPTTVAALQLVEQNLVDLDEDITRVLPEWRSPHILKGFDGDTGEPILKPSTKKMTLRHLLTHSAGMCYGDFSPEARAYKKAISKSLNQESILEETSLLPLLYEPGDGWRYSDSLAWAGVVVERVSGEEHLEDYMEKHIWGPLGMKMTTFYAELREDVKSRLVPMFERQAEGGLGISTFNTIGLRFDTGGSGMFTTPTDYVKLLSALLQNDRVLLKSETVNLMFTPQLPDSKYLDEVLARMPPDFKAAFLSGIPEDSKVNWGLGGLLALEDVPEKRKRGTLSWSGMPNLFWVFTTISLRLVPQIILFTSLQWIDPASGVYGYYAAQIFPFGDVPTVELYHKFEKAAYEELKNRSRQ
ncbi:MAG: hypothetical protein M1819_005464 [Sarea resinae]|nr:MAG: hypothetical protein M1819_005464 [Sarea resinae]